MYDLRFMPPARNYFKKLKDSRLAASFRDALTEISANPYEAGAAKTGDLAGIYCKDVFYNKTNYEIAYRIIEEDDCVVIVILAGTRENFYKELKRYMSL